jgi:hypothetical protein
VGDGFPKLLAGLAAVVGVAAVLIGLSVFVEAWQASRAWAGSDEARLADAPVQEPIWLDESSEGSAAGGVAASLAPGDVQGELPERRDPEPHAIARLHPPVSASDPGADEDGALSSPFARGQGLTEVSSLPLPRPAEEDSATVGASPPGVGGGGAGWEREATPVALASPSDVELAEVDFRFLDPPEPGAHARLAVTVVNRASLQSGPISVLVPSRWLQSFEVFGAIPGVHDDRADVENERRFVFNSLSPGERQTVELHVLATAEEVDAPEVRVLLSAGAEVGRAQPRTVAPRPRPGPARAVAIPKLGVRASVVPVPWEPPPFVVGQLDGTAAVSQGNTVLIGHLAGPLGDVFARLDRLRPGDEVVATSRGLEYRFVVSEIAVRPYDDVQPTQPTTSPRLTLMTCTGQWSVTRQDYTHRVWVVAEPPELAEQTIRANADRAAQAAREAEEAAAARAAHEAEITGTATAQATQPAVAERASESSTPRAAEASRATPATADGQPPDAAEEGGDAQPVPPSSVASGGASTRPPGIAVDAPASDVGSAGAPALAPGISVVAPPDRSAVGRQFTVRGRRTALVDSNAPLWLAVRAEVAGSRWYVLDRPLAPARDGTWTATVDLGGPVGVSHEVRVGVLDAAGDAELRRHVAERPGQPLDDLPSGFRTGGRIVVEHR